MENQQKILPMGRLQRVTVDIDGASMQMDFEVIEIVDDSNPYPTLLGIDWATDMNGVINLKKRKMIFKKKSLHVVVPLDPAKGECYNEPVHNDGSDDKLDCIYKITAQDQDWLNLTIDRRVSWERVGSYPSDLDEEDKDWHNQLSKVTMLNCNMMTKLVRYVTYQDRDLPTYDGLKVVDEFLNKFESTVLEHQRFNALKWAPRMMPTHWWGTHEGNFDN